MEDDNIYDDLDNQGDLGAIITDLQTKNKELQRHVTSLEGDVKKLCDRITEMKTVQDNLTRNISALFNTAKSELDRKNRRINELQSQLDDMIFKRNSKPQPVFKRKQEEPNLDHNTKRARYETIEKEPSHNINENVGKYDRNIGPKEDIQKPEIINLESDLHSSLREDTDPTRKAYSKDNSHSRDRRDNYRDNKDGYRDNRDGYRDNRDGYRDNRDSFRDNRDSSRGNRDNFRDNYNDRSTYRDSKMEQREVSKDHKNTYRENRYSNKGNWNRSRDKRGRSREHGENNREQRFDYRENRERSNEYRNDKPEMKHTSKQNDNFKYTEDNNRQMDRHSESKPV